MSAVAEKAGVQRHTYYAHFPELKDLYQACTAHNLERNPVPDPSRWAEISGPEERLRVALSEVYAYFSREEAMLSNVLRDTPLGAHQATYHPYHQPHCPILAQLLLAHKRAPRLEVQR